MNRDDINRIVVDFARNHLSPTQRERSFISTKYEELQSFLKGRTFQSGSYARFTSTTPVNDLDVIYILPEEILKKTILIESGALDINNILESLTQQLRYAYAKQARVIVQPHSVGIYFGGDDDFSIKEKKAI